MRILLLCLCIAFSVPLSAQRKRTKLPAELSEASGLFIAGPDSLWWHNDSDGKASLFLTDGNGRLIAGVPIPCAINKDWEDLSADWNGRLYIGDFGNNANRRKDLCIYIFDSAANTTDSILFSYPDQMEFPPPPSRAAFDMEAFFWWNDTLHLFSKNRLLKGDYITRHYTLPAQPGRYAATLVDSVLLPKRVVTAAAIRPDGGQVALLSYYFKLALGFIPITRTSVFLWEDFPGSLFLRGSRQVVKVRKCLLPALYEAIDYADAQNLLIASESVPLRRAHWRMVKIAKTARPARP